MKNITIAFRYLKINLAAAMSFKSSFYLQVFGMVISNLSFVVFWHLTFQHMGGSVGFYTFSDVMFIWGITSAAFGLTFILFAGVGNLSRMIMSGELDTYILQPCSTLLNVMCSRTMLSAYGDLAYGILLLVFTQKLLYFQWLLVIVCVLLATCVMVTFNLILNSLAFFFGNMLLLQNISLEILITLSTYPSGIFGNGIKAIMLSAIPAFFISHLPLELVSTKILPLILGQVLFTIIYFFVGRGIFYCGLKRYSSSSLITTRH